MLQKSKLTSWIGVVIGIVGVFADNPNVLPEQYAHLLSLIGVAIAAIGRSLLPSPNVETSTDVQELSNDH